MKKDTKKIESTLSLLLKEIEELRNSPGQKKEYREKLKQLMYWRRRRNQMGANYGRNTDSDQGDKKEGPVSSIRESCNGDFGNIEFEENPF